MKLLLNAALLFGVCCGYAASLTPEIAPPAQWKLEKGVSHVRKDGKDLIVLNVKESESAGKHYAEIPLDLSAHGGKYTTFSIKMRSQGWKQDKKDRERRGIRFIVTYQHPENKRTVNHHTWDTWDTVDWEKYSGQKKDAWRVISFFSLLDEKVSKATLLLGTENNFGTAEFDLSTLQICQPFKEDTSNLICEYTDRVKSTPILRGVGNSPNPMTEDDLKTLHSWNVNAVRYWTSTYAWAFDKKDLQKFRQYLEKRLENLDKIAPIAEKYGIRLIVGGSAPGGRRGDASYEMQHDPKYADFYVEMWKLIAQRCKGKKAVWGYDLLNEPQQTMPLPIGYMEIQHRAAKAIREIDPDIPVIIESNLLAAPKMFRFLEPLDMKNVIYQAHMYIPAEFTHSTVAPYPGVINGKYWDKEALRKVLQPVVDFQKRHKARIYIGEFSVRARAVGADRYLRDCIDLFEEYGWDWTYHSFREAPTWDVEKEWKDGKHVPSAGNARKTVLLDALKKNLAK